MKISLLPQGVCCRQMDIDISEDNKIISASFYGGCNGNLQGISKLIEGMDINNVISKLEGISCGGKETSCPDQLTKGLKEYLKMYKNETSQKQNF